jgi:hypothetical protein
MMADKAGVLPMRKLFGSGLLALGLVVSPAMMLPSLAQEEMAKEIVPSEFSVSKSRSSNGMHVLRYRSKTDNLVISDIIINKGRCHTVFARYPLQASINTSIEVYVDCEPFSVKTTTVNKDYLKIFNNY